MIDKRVNTACQVTDRDSTSPETELKKIKRGTGQDTLLKTILWMPAYGMCQRQEREKMQSRGWDICLRLTGIWDSVKGPGRVWKGMCNLPGWKRQRRNSHGFLLRMWESDPMPKDLLVTSKSYINFVLLLQSYTLYNMRFFSFWLGFLCFCCLGAFFFFQVSWKANVSVHVNIKTCFLSVWTQMQNYTDTSHKEFL